MSNATPLRELPAKWRSEACDMRYTTNEPGPHDGARAEELEACADELEAALSARQEEGAVGWPLKVFSEGPWVFEETGQRFSGADLDGAAFAAYRIATPPASGEAGAVFRAAAPDAAAPSVPSPTVRLTVPAAPASGDAKDALDVLAGLRRFITHAHCQIDAPRETIARYDAAVATLARLAAVAGAGVCRCHEGNGALDCSIHTQADFDAALDAAIAALSAQGEARPVGYVSQQVIDGLEAEEYGIGGVTIYAAGWPDAIALYTAPGGVGDAVTWAPKPTKSGWYWHFDGDVTRMQFVFPRPGHSYLAVYDEPNPTTGKRNFRMAEKMGGQWCGPLNVPELPAAALAARTGQGEANG